MTLKNLRLNRKPFSEIDEVERESWRRLHEESPHSRWAFLSPEFSEAVNACVTPVSVVFFWQGNEIVGVLPLQRQRSLLGKFGLFEAAGGNTADYFGLIAKPMVKTSWKELLKLARVPCIYFSHLDEVQECHGLKGSQPRKSFRTRIHLEEGAAYWEWLREQDKELVRDTERRERKLQRDHGLIEFEMQSSNLYSDFTELVALKNAQYLRTGQKGGALLDHSNVEMLRYLLSRNGTGAKLLLSTLRCNGRLCALHLGLQSGGTLHRWFPAYDPNFATYSPGRILYRHMLLSAGKHGINCIDRGDGDTTAKREFATESHNYLKGLETFGMHGKVLSIVQRLIWRLAK